MKKSMILFFFIYSGLLFCQTAYYLEGKLGKSIIYMSIEEFSSEGNEINATYFYENSLKDIVLNGTREKNKFVIVFKNNSNNAILEKFELVKSSGNTFNGFWFNSKGKKIALQLDPIHFSKYKSAPNSFKTDNKLDIIKLKHIRFIQDSLSKYKGKEIIWYSEKHCKMPFFRLGNNFPEDQKRKTNPLLDEIHTESVLSQLSCSTRFEYSTGEGIEQTTKIGYLNSNLLGFEIFRSWYCGGAHPDFGGQGYLIDLKSGKNYAIDEIIAFDKSVTTEKKGGFEAFSGYREKYFAPGIYALINATEKFKKPKEDNGEDCDYTDLGSWNFVSWNFTETGIQITPYFYRAARNCDTPFLILFKSLRKYKNPTFPYNF